MRREVQTVAVPVFQFGIYSENDLSFFAGPDFDWRPGPHEPERLLGPGRSASLTLRDVFTAVGEVVRTHLANGVPISTSGHRGYVRAGDHRREHADVPPPEVVAPRAAIAAAAPGRQRDGCECAAERCRTAGVPTMVLVPGNTRNRPTWTNISTGTYSNRVLQRRDRCTAARPAPGE
jgi:hypothetical protein